MAVSIAIRELLEGQTVASSRLTMSMVEELLNERLLVPMIRGSRKSYRASDVEALKRYLMDKDESYRILELPSCGDLSRADQAAETGNSKLVTVRSCPGFMVNSYEPIHCKLNGQCFEIFPQEGSMIFISDWQNFEIPSDVIVVGIENMENFRFIRQQREFFQFEISSSVPLLFVSRYPQSTDLRKWLSSIPNRYVHFGDFDLAGINTFLTEFYQYLGEKSHFLIPSDIEARLVHGSVERYNVQYTRFKNLSANDEHLQTLIDLIHQYRRGYDQEGYIVKSRKV